MSGLLFLLFYYCDPNQDKWIENGWMDAWVHVWMSFMEDLHYRTCASKVMSSTLLGSVIKWQTADFSSYCLFTNYPHLIWCHSTTTSHVHSLWCILILAGMWCQSTSVCKRQWEIAAGFGGFCRIFVRSLYSKATCTVLQYPVCCSCVKGKHRRKFMPEKGLNVSVFRCTELK